MILAQTTWWMVVPLINIGDISRGVENWFEQKEVEGGVGKMLSSVWDM